MSIFLPCLLERWSTETPQGTGARGVFNTWQDVRRDVIRNLEWLLNTEAPPRLAGQVPSEAVQRSVLCFGIEPYSGRPQSGMDPKEMSWRIRERILAFESRVDHHTRWKSKRRVIVDLDMFGPVCADADANPEPAQALHRVVIGEVRALHLIAEILQHLGNAAHANAADADKMQHPHIQRHGGTKGKWANGFVHGGPLGLA